MIGCPIRKFNTWIDKFGLFRIGVGYVLIICGLILAFNGLFFNLLLYKNNHLLFDKKEIIFEEIDIQNQLLIGKIFISILTGSNLTIIVYSYMIMIFDINIICK